MSFLTPLYALGILAVAAPIVFHLIRRSPRGEVPFSTLMFLAPTPPRLTRRSRLDHLLLLLLRAAALCLLAFAFARPFLRQAARLDFGAEPRRRIAVLVDTSASMRRGDLWPRARALATRAIGECGPNDQLAVLAFDRRAQPVLGFDESTSVDPARRKALAQGRLDGLAPTWAGTNLGQALIDAVAAIEDVADASAKSARMPRRVILISDLQEGSRLDALGNFEWPSDVELELRTVADTGANAGLQILGGPSAADADPRLRVRVTNNPGSRREAFRLAWEGSGDGKPLDVYVPAGESRVVRLARPAGTGRSRVLRLAGDAHAFDNAVYLADESRDDAVVRFLGDDAADDPAGLRYFLDRVFQDSTERTVRVEATRPSAPLRLDPKRPPAIVIVAGAPSAENLRGLEAYLRGGGTVLFVARTAGPAPGLAALAGVPAIELAEAAVSGDVMLGEIAFDHPLFAPLAGPEFNDFTKIHFWKYRKLDDGRLPGAKVLARFEKGDPAIVEKGVGEGKLLVLASGWNTADSQLARSSKFVPLMACLLEYGSPPRFDPGNHLVGEVVSLPDEADSSRARAIRRPDGSVARLAAGSRVFEETDLPGVYAVDAAAGPQTFAVNLDPLESKTAALHVETLEQLGCRLVSHSPRAVDREHQRQLQNLELESRQKLWRWLILAAIGVLIVETWLAGRVRRPRSAPAEAVTT